eukprot:CAMPEP_0204627258 /NCGR_PEP_ID=MMETSP0717-20131115/13330_1 /ASSEMBLY_ACC=CAM_ASM_000666 /TAXON_ID=230516 /ORGANISM="Chaetoceros curvisetus" /LENGTH=144 /DNA_ID=CAMNT_0051643445 /DNA_START=46 /DNA_END=480 /DNA_ORIENTATION=-
MTKANLDLHFVVDMISKPNIIAMALIDTNVLMRGIHKSIDHHLDEEYYGEKSEGNETSSFSGHYCLLIGISTHQNDISKAKTRFPTEEDDGSGFCIVVKDPGSSNPFDFITPRLFYRSWAAIGTDKDIIFIANWQERYWNPSYS